MNLVDTAVRAKTGVELRVGEARHIAAIAALDREARGEDCLSEAELQRLHDLDPEGFVVAFVGRELIAYAVGTSRRAQRSGTIVALAVKRNYHNPAVARALLDYQINRHRKVGMLWTDTFVRPDDSVTRAACRDLGYNEYGTRGEMVGQGGGRLELRLML